MNVTLDTHLTAIDEIAAQVTDGQHWTLVPFTPDTTELLVGLQLRRLTGVTLWIETDPECVIRLTDVDAQFAALLAVLIDQLDGPFAWVATAPKATNTRTTVLAACGGKLDAPGAHDEERDVIGLMNPDATHTSVPVLWVDALTRADPTAGHQLLVDLQNRPR